MNTECFSRRVAAICDMASAGDRGIFCFDRNVIRCRFSKKCDIGITCCLGRENARRFTAIFGFRTCHLHADRFSIANTCYMIDVFNRNIFSFNVKVGSTHFFTALIMSVCRKETMAAKIHRDVTVCRINRINDEVAVLFRQLYTVLSSSRKDAFTSNVHI